MEIVVLLVCLGVAVLTGTALSERLRLPEPMVLIALGALASFLPFVPAVQLPPEVVLFGMLPPLLYSTALRTSIVDIRRNLLTVSLLSVGLVVVITATVGWVVHWLIPSIPLPVAFALGAVVAPPDAVSASAVARKVGLPRRIVTVLEGESLLNDATSLVALRAAIAAIAGAVSLGTLAWQFLLAAGGGLVIGLVIALVASKVRSFVRNPLFDVGISFIIPFAAYCAAEAIEASGVIAVVVAGLIVGYKAPVVQTAESRITGQLSWATIAFLLENSVFFLIGLEATTIIIGLVQGEASDLTGWQILGFCAAVLATVIVTRIVWVCATRAVLGLIRPTRQPPWSHALITSWAGMRGVVTLAAVFVIPESVSHHNLLVLAALSVVLGTLYLQGLTLPFLTRLLRVRPDDPSTDTLARATLVERAGVVGREALEKFSDSDPHGAVTLARERVEHRTLAAWERLGTTPGEETPSETYARTRRAMLTAERAEVLRLRGTGKFPEHVVNEVLTILDHEESLLDPESNFEESVVGTGLGEGGWCDDLREHPVRPAPQDLQCQECLDEGLRWVALRMCLDCGRVACCDSSVGRHATKHYYDSQHPVMESVEPGESWRWCYVHRLTG